MGRFDFDAFCDRANEFWDESTKARTERRKFGGIFKQLYLFALVGFVVNLMGIILAFGAVTWVVIFVLQIMGVLL